MYEPRYIPILVLIFTFNSQGKWNSSRTAETRRTIREDQCRTQGSFG